MIVWFSSNSKFKIYESRWMAEGQDTPRARCRHIIELIDSTPSLPSPPPLLSPLPLFMPRNVFRNEIKRAYTWISNFQINCALVPAFESSLVFSLPNFKTQIHTLVKLIHCIRNCSGPVTRRKFDANKMRNYFNMLRHWLLIEDCWTNAIVLRGQDHSMLSTARKAD